MPLLDRLCQVERVAETVLLRLGRQSIADFVCAGAYQTTNQFLDVMQAEGLQRQRAGSGLSGQHLDEAVRVGIIPARARRATDKDSRRLFLVLKNRLPIAVDRRMEVID